MTPNETAERALKPCPGCGAEPMLQDEDEYSYVRCACGWRGPNAYLESDDGGDKCEAAARESWNRRAASPVMQNGPEGETHPPDRDCSCAVCGPYFADNPISASDGAIYAAVSAALERTVQPCQFPKCQCTETCAATSRPGPACGLPKVRAPAPIRMLPTPYERIYEVDSYFGVHRQFHSGRFNGALPARSVAVYSEEQVRALLAEAAPAAEPATDWKASADYWEGVARAQGDNIRRFTAETNVEFAKQRLREAEHQVLVVAARKADGALSQAIGVLEADDAIVACADARDALRRALGE